METLRETIMRLDTMGIPLVRDGVKYMLPEIEDKRDQCFSISHTTHPGDIVADIANATGDVLDILEGTTIITRSSSGKYAPPNGIKEVHLPNTVQQIERSSFVGYAMEELIIPDSVYSIEFSVFADCKNLRYCRLSEQLTTIPDELFRGCSNLKLVDIPPEVDVICADAFSHCGFEEFTMPPKTIVIMSGAFLGCEQLKKVEFNKGLHTIDSDAFQSCTSLEEVTIPRSVEVYRASVFSYCKNLRHVYLPTELKPKKSHFSIKGVRGCKVEVY